MSKKKIGIIVGVIIAVLVLGGVGVYFLSGATASGDSENRVYVEQVSSVISVGAGMQSRFNGVVESQASHEVNVDSSRKIAKIHVEVGDEVTEGQKLVTYDTSDLQLQVDQANLEVESINNDIATYMNQIINQNNIYQSAEPEEQQYILSEIQNLQNSISQRQFDLQSKQLEIAKYQEQIKKSYVNSEYAGTVKEINEKGIDANGNSAPFMTILQSGEYRVKGSIDEQNIWTLSEGMPVILRSRVDEEETWTGSIEKIDTENPQQSNNNYYGNGETVMASKYPFYIVLDDSEGLILGQHVYIELNEGQEEEKTGIWLTSSYIVQEENGAFVWASNSRERLEKRTVELGEYDENLDQYQILSGLTEEDYICWPMEGLYEGVATVTNMEEQVWNPEIEEDAMMEDGMMDEYYDMGTEYMDTEFSGEMYGVEMTTEVVEEME